MPIDLSTKYLGLKLRSPLVVSASPMSEDIDNIKRMEDAGAAAVVLYSLFEEQLRQDRLELDESLQRGTNSSAEALSFFPEPEDFRLGPEEYLKHIAAAKKAARIPIIASLNGSSEGGWTDYAKKIKQAGADALELNIYYIPTDPQLTALDVENTYLDILKAVKAAITIPVTIPTTVNSGDYQIAVLTDAFGKHPQVFSKLYVNMVKAAETGERATAMPPIKPGAARRFFAPLTCLLRESKPAASGKPLWNFFRANESQSPLPQGN